VTTIIELADAIRDDLAQASLSQDLSIERRLVPEFDVKELGTLKTTVRPAGEEIAFESRAATRHDYVIEICLWKKVTTDDGPAVEELITLLQEVADYFRFRQVTGRAERMAGVRTIVHYEDETQRSHRLYRGIVQLLFRGWRT
jgi:hypothetical protein